MRDKEWRNRRALANESGYSVDFKTLTNAYATQIPAEMYTLDLMESLGEEQKHRARDFDMVFGILRNMAHFKNQPFPVYIQKETTPELEKFSWAPKVLTLYSRSTFTGDYPKVQRLHRATMELVESILLGAEKGVVASVRRTRGEQTEDPEDSGNFLSIAQVLADPELPEEKYPSLTDKLIIDIKPTDNAKQDYVQVSLQILMGAAETKKMYTVPFVHIAIQSDTHGTDNKWTPTRHEKLWDPIIKNIGRITREIHTGCTGHEQLETLAAAQDANFANANWRQKNAINFFFDTMVSGGELTQNMLFRGLNRALGTAFGPVKPDRNNRPTKRRKKTSEEEKEEEPDTEGIGHSDGA